MLINSKILAKKCDEHISYDLENGNIGCGVIEVRQNGELKYNKAFGEVHFSENDTPTNKTVFRLASMTKPITTVAALILFDRGSLSPNDTVEKFIPEFSSASIGELNETGNVITLCPAKTKIKVAHLLNHTSGLGCLEIGIKTDNNMSETDKATLESATKYYSTVPLAFEPGSKASYSPTAAFNVLARIIEIVSNKSFDKFLKDEIFDKLGMTDTTFNPTQEQWQRMTYMHNKSGNKSVQHPTTENCVFFDFPVTQTCGGAGLASTMDDYIKFAQMLLNDGEYNGVRIVSKESIFKMRTPQVSAKIMPRNNERWGLGVRVITSPDYKRLPVGAYGWSGAYGSHFFIDPVNKITAIYMKNSRYDGGSGTKTGAQLEQDIFESLE